MTEPYAPTHMPANATQLALDVSNAFHRAYFCGAGEAGRASALIALAVALTRAEGLGDYGGLPVSLPAWAAALRDIRAWCSASDDARKGAVTDAAFAAAGAIIGRPGRRRAEPPPRSTTFTDADLGADMGEPRTFDARQRAAGEHLQ